MASNSILNNFFGSTNVPSIEIHGSWYWRNIELHYVLCYNNQTILLSLKLGYAHDNSLMIATLSLLIVFDEGNDMYLFSIAQTKKQRCYLLPALALNNQPNQQTYLTTMIICSEQYFRKHCSWLWEVDCHHVCQSWLHLRVGRRFILKFAAIREFHWSKPLTKPFNLTNDSQSHKWLKWTLPGSRRWS